VVVAATSGVSAIIAPDGSELARSPVFTPAALVEPVPLRTTTTLATRLGAAPEWLLTAVGLVALGLAWRRRPAAAASHRRATPNRRERTRMADPHTRAATGRWWWSSRPTTSGTTCCDRGPAARRRAHRARAGRGRRQPDGTGKLADALAAEDPRVRVMHRKAKDGLGAAYLAGFSWALERDYQVIVQMDADGSHPPESLPAMLAALADADLVLGSRYVSGGTVVNWPKHRELLSRGGNLYSRLALGVRIRDITAGYRVFRKHVLAELALGEVNSQGTASRSTWPGGPCGPVSGSGKSPSRSPSGNGATPR